VGRGFLGLFLTFTPPHILGLLSPSPSPDLGPPVDFSLAPPSPPLWDWCQGEKGTLAQIECVWEFPPTMEPREGVPVSLRSQ
jgi:hypothetical protein